MRSKLVSLVVGLCALVGPGFGCVADQDSLGSAEQSVDDPNPSGLVAPTVTAAASSTSRIEVTWDATPMATKYYVFQATAGGAFSYLSTTSETSYSSAGLTPDTEYSFKVQSADATSVSPDSATATATTTITTGNPSVFGAPTNVTATAVLSTRIQVDWTAVTGAAKYYVFQAEGAGPMVYVTTVLTNGYTARGLAPSTTYSFEIQAVTPWEAVSASSSPPASVNTFLAPPTVTATAVSASRIEVDWTATPGAVKYYVFQAEGAGPSIYVGTQVSNSFTAAGLAAGTTYSFVVQAVDASNNASSTSVPSSATTSGGSAGVLAPDVTATAISSSRVELSWSAVSGATKYYVFQDNVYLGTALTNGWTATGLSASTSYTFVVQAVDGANNASASSVPASATTFTDGSGVAAPLDVTASALSTSQVFVSWSASASAAKYYVFQTSGAVRTYVTTVSSPTTSLVVSGLAASTEYSFVIQAVDADDRASSDSSAAVATTLD